MAKVKYYAKENSTIGTHSFYAVPIPNGTLTFDELLDEAMDGIEGMSSDRGILLGIILYFCHFLSVLKGLTLLILEECELSALVVDATLCLVEVFFVQLKADEVPTLLDASDGGRAAAHEGVENYVTFVAP